MCRPRYNNLYFVLVFKILSENEYWLKRFSTNYRMSFFFVRKFWRMCLSWKFICDRRYYIPFEYFNWKNYMYIEGGKTLIKNYKFFFRLNAMFTLTHFFPVSGKPVKCTTRFSFKSNIQFLFSRVFSSIIQKTLKCFRELN